MNKITILLADDHPIVRSGLRSLLSSQPEFEIIGEAENGEEAIEAIKRLKPAIALLDISMPKLSGTEAAKIISQKYSHTKVIILTMIEEEAYIGKVIEAGAYAYLLKDSGNDEIIKAIHRVVQGEKYFSQSAYDLIGRQFSKKNIKSKDVENDNVINTLTAREKEILGLIAEGLNSQQIAKKLFLSPRTIETHRSNLMHKLRIHTATGLVRFAIENKIV
ncbi:response regulator transcription factor [bacterium]|nr:response regulator transcription factor [bacterium]